MPQITQSETKNVKRKWADGVIEIGRLHREGGDYVAAAKQHLHDLYAFAEMPVLFKPTLASHVPFRLNYDDALSYFIGGDIDEDAGFALRPWVKIDFENKATIFDDRTAISTGHYFFTDLKGEEITVEYTLGFIRCKDGQIRIFLQHSSLPYSP